MIRTLAGIGFALALVGSAHAQGQQLVVQTAGKSAQNVRVELYNAAKAVCTTSDSLNTWDSACVEDTYLDALHQLRGAPHLQLTAYNSSSAPSQR